MSSTKGTARIAVSDLSRNLLLEKSLDERGIRWEYRAELPIAEIDRSEAIQVRLAAPAAPIASVRAYAVSLKSGATFPAILVNANKELGDGNTRVAAYQQAERTHIPAYILEVGDDEMRLLALEMNQKNGTRMVTKDVQTQIMAYTMAHPTTPLRPAVWAERTGIDASRIKRWVKVANFERRASDAGVSKDVLATLNDTTKLRLDRLGSQSLLDKSTNLVRAAGLSSNEVNALVADLQESAKISEEKALDHLETLRQAYRERISTGITTPTGPAAFSQHKMHLSYLVKSVNVTDLRTVINEDAHRDARALVESVITRLQEVLADDDLAQAEAAAEEEDVA